MRSFIPQMVDRWFRTQDVFGPDSAIASAPGRGRNAIAPTTWFVDAQLGNDGHSGTNPQKPKKLLQPLIGNGSSSKAHSGDVIYVVGNITEEITGYNLLEDITIIGIGNRPRHADHARDYATYAFASNSQDEISGVSWRQAASHGATTPLLKIRGQGWHIENILFVPPSDAAALYLDRNALSDVSEYDPSHLTVKGCRFAGGQSGIEDSGGCFNVHVVDCDFNAGTNGIKTLNTAVAQPQGWLVDNCRFWNETNYIVTDFTNSVIRYSSFHNGATLYIKLNQVGNTGGKNAVYQNSLGGTYSNVGGYYANGSTDEWGGNWNSIAGGVTAADPA